MYFRAFLLPIGTLSSAGTLTVICLALASRLSFSEAPFIAGHDLLEMSYRFESPPNPARTIVRRSFGRFNDSAFLDCFGCVLDEEHPHPLEGLSSTVEVETFLESLHGAIVFVLDN